LKQFISFLYEHSSHGHHPKKRFWSIDGMEKPTSEFSFGIVAYTNIRKKFFFKPERTVVISFFWEKRRELESRKKRV